jgi:hypothetical protein
MIRYLITAASVLALVSGVALAEPVEGTKSVTIRHTPYGNMIHKRFMNHRGQMVSKKVIRNGISGSTAKRKTVAEPGMGGSVTTRTKIEQ